MPKDEDVLNPCGHRNSERVKAEKELPSSLCPACLFERINELEARSIDCPNRPASKTEVEMAKRLCDYQDEVHKLKQRIKEFEDYLIEFGQHKPLCIANITREHCNCGFKQALKS